MTINELETKLKEMDQRFEIVPHPNADDVAGVYFDRNIEHGTGFVLTIPSKDIYEEFNPSYHDIMGHPYQSIPMVMIKAQAYKEKFDTDEEFRKMVSEPLPL